MKAALIYITKLREQTPERLLLKVCFGMFALVLLFMAYVVRTKAPGDYLNYYYGTKFFFQGISVYSIYDAASFNTLIAAEGIEKAFSNYTPVPPFSLLFYYPFTGISFVWSKMIFNVVSIFLFMVSLYRLCVRQRIKPLHVSIVLGILIYPIYNNLVQGQSYLLILSLLIEGYLFSLKGRTWISSLLFAIPIALKLFPVIILIWLYVTGRKKELWQTIIFTCLLLLVVLPFVGTSFWFSYHTSILTRLLSGEINDPFSVTFQSYSVLLKKAFVYDRMLNPSVLLHAQWLYILLNTLITAAFMQASVQLIRACKSQPLQSFGITFVCGLLISGYGTNYGLVLLLFIGLAILQSDKNKMDQYILLLLLLCIAFFQVGKFVQYPIFLQFGRLYLMIAFFILMTRKEHIVWFNRESLVILLLLFLPVSLRCFQKQDESDYYLSREPSLFITTYKQTAEGLMLYYIGADGSDSVVYRTIDQIHLSDQLYINHNQIFINGKRITSGNDLKRQPAFLNKNEIIYLSDQGRGPGLTTLRNIKCR
jgi:hypothetical protein